MRGRLLVIVLALAGAANTAAPQPTHSVFISSTANSAIAAVPATEVMAFCATAWYASEQERAVYLQEVRPAGTTNPVCEPAEAAVLVRPGCVFNLAEFVLLRARAMYVVLLCNTDGAEGGLRGGVGIPLERWHRPPNTNGLSRA